jgi:HEAT repeat protein
MRRFGPVAILAGVGLSLWGCAATVEDERLDEVMNRAAFLFSHYGEAQKHHDAQMLTVVRGDLRRLNVESFEVLIRAITLGNQEDRGYAAFVLGFSAQHGAVGPLTTATTHPDETVRGNAIAALGELGFPDAPMEPFQRLLKDSYPEVRQATLFGLTRLVTPQNDLGMFTPIHESLADPDPQVRTEALLTVRKMKRKDSVPFILAGPIQDPDPLVRTGAAQALGAIGREASEATPFLIELLKDESHKVVEGAWWALNKIHDKDFDRSYSTWRDWFEDEQKIRYSCPEHKDVISRYPGLCPKCQNRLERVPREAMRKVEQLAAPAPGLYVCPDHPEVVTTLPAKCGKPGCGKDLVPKKPDPVLYICPDHPDIITTTPSKCGKPGCGKDLVPKN